MDKWEALYSFWASFGYPAYEENSVPDLDEVVFPYITYEARSSPFDGDVTVNASIWTRDRQWTEADMISDMIETRLENGGAILDYFGGKIWITADQGTFSQSLGDPTDDMIKRKLISVTYHFY